MPVNFKSNVLKDISNQQKTTSVQPQTTETVDKSVNEDKNSDKGKNPFAILGGILGGGLAGATIGGLTKKNAKVVINEAEILKSVEESCTKEFNQEILDALTKFKNGEQLTDQAADLLHKLGYDLSDIVKKAEFTDTLIEAASKGNIVRGEGEALIKRGIHYKSSLGNEVLSYLDGNKDALNTIKEFQKEYKRNGIDVDLESMIHNSIKEMDVEAWENFQKTGVVKYKNTVVGHLNKKLPDISYEYKAENLLKEKIQDKSKALLEAAKKKAKDVEVSKAVKKGGLIGAGVATVIASGIVIHNYMQKKQAEKSQN